MKKKFLLQDEWGKRYMQKFAYLGTRHWCHFKELDNASMRSYWW